MTPESEAIRAANERRGGSPSDVDGLFPFPDGARRAAASFRIEGLGAWEWDFGDRVWWSEEVYRIFGRDSSVEQADLALYRSHLDDAGAAAFSRALHEALVEDRPYRVEHAVRRADGERRWIRAEGVIDRDPAGRPVRLWGVVRDVTAEHDTHASLAGQQCVLERIASGAPARECLDAVLTYLEERLPGVYASVHLLDRDGKTLRFAAGDHLPRDYVAAVRAFAIGPGVGSCGTAAALRTPVYVADLAEDPLWQDYRAFALPHGFRACWSTPIFAGRSSPRAGQVLGTLAVYRKAVGLPSDAAAATLATATYLAAAALDREASHEALRESESRFRDVLDGSPVAAFLKDLDGRYRYVNRTAAAVLGRPPADFVGRYAHEILPESVAAQFAAADREVAATLRPRTSTESAVDPTGVRRTFLSVEFPLFRDDGAPYALCGIGSDVTERERAEAALRQAQAVARLGNWTFDVAERTIDGSAEMRRIAELPPGPRPFTEWLERVHPEDRAVFRERLERALRGEDIDHEFRLRRGETNVFLEMRARPERDAAGRIRRLDGTVQDVTERRRLEEALRQSQKMEAVGRLAGGVAHDFNNVLTVIRGYLELLLESTPAPDPRRADLEAVRDASERAALLTGQLLAFGRRTVLSPRVLDVNEAVAGPTELLRRLLGEDVRLEIALGSDVGRARLDPGALEQILVNLAVNARDAMPDGGRVVVATRGVTVSPGVGADPEAPAPGRYAEISVRNDGVGMTDEVRSRVFEPFFTTKSAGNGTGLGLAVVYGVVRQCGGAVAVESAPGRGTVFRVLLPVVDARGAPDAPYVEARAPGADRRDDARPGDRVLVVEDEPEVRRLTAAALEKRGYEVVAAPNAEVALRHLAAPDERFSVLVTDVVMPGLGGRELADRARLLHPALPVVFMSGHVEDEVLRHGVAEARDIFLQKPFAAGALARLVRETIDRAAKPSLSAGRRTETHA